ncbi:hypothetical protein PVAP13_8KG186600 [Panicum virgatum]|uniref:Uncharacterized protein n=1 Tax=Panicum virgatum TaxID=38727 RepID=A0A8T0PZ93_PANVG|nr:hypothetical protein PVAP13_8KG186600 [Panicum virgatum]
MLQQVQGLPRRRNRSTVPHGAEYCLQIRSFVLPSGSCIHQHRSIFLLCSWSD